MTDSQRQATNKWQKANMTVLSCKVRKDLAEEFRTACRANNTTPNAVFRTAILAYLTPHPEEPAKEQPEFPVWLLRLYSIYKRLNRRKEGN